MGDFCVVYSVDHRLESTKMCLLQRIHIFDYTTELEFINM
jgi:hypothetical protein